MKLMRTRAQKTMHRLCILFLIVSFIGCGGGNSSENRESSNRSAAISFQLKFSRLPSQRAQTRIDHAISEPDICMDYAIDTIAVYVYQTQDNTEVASAESACADHRLTVKNVPAGQSLYVVCEGLVGPNTAWQGRRDDIVAIANQNTDIGIIDMQYIGDDTTGPEIISTFPSADATDVDLSAWIVVVFNEALAPSTIPDQAISVLDSDIPVPGQVSYDPSTRSIRFAPADAYSFDSETTYSVTLQSQDNDNRTITDIAGNPLTGDVSWQFSTRGSDDTTAPQIIAISPVSGATDVGQQCSISVVFSEPMDPDSLNDSVFQLSSDQGPISGQIVYDDKTRTLSMTPDSALDAATLYTAVISSQARDLEQNSLLESYTWQFWTSGPLYELTVIKTGSGSGRVSSTPPIIECGDTCKADLSAGTKVTLGAIANNASEFNGWSGDYCNGDTGSCTFTMTSNTTISANFVSRTYIINTSVMPEDGSGGSISPTNATVIHGDDQAFDIRANPYYSLSELYVDGSPVSPASSYLFENVVKNHNLHAVFARNASNISNNPSSQDMHPRINNNGHVVWIGNTSSKDELYYYDGSVVTIISDNQNSDNYYGHRMNNNGNVAWLVYNQSRWDIYYYNKANDTVANISETLSGERSLGPQINADGHVVWDSIGESGWQINYYNRRTKIITNISVNVDAVNHHGPSINANGHIVWHASASSDNYEIYYYNKETESVTNISNNSSADDLFPHINTDGDIVWYGRADVDSDYDIYYYDNGNKTVTIISDNPNGDDLSPQINDNGDIVWYGRIDANSKSDSYYWDKVFKTVTNISNTPDGEEKICSINRDGLVVWSEYKNSDEEIYLSFP